MATDLSGKELAEKLRRDDPEQFQTLVRMHLSFVLDLNTDDHDCSEKNKFRPSKWVFGKKTKCLQKGVMEGAPLTQEGICQVYQLIEFLSKEPNICQEGLFRRTGKLTRQQDLKNLLNSGVCLNLDEGLFSVHDCASVLKSFLAELPEPLLTDAHYPIYCQIAELCSGAGAAAGGAERMLPALQLLLLLLPAENQILLRDVLQLLSRTAGYEHCNKMSAQSLSTLFTPHLLCPRRLSPEAFHTNSQAMSGIMAFMIHKGSALFDIPPKLATDIRVYWAERERRRPAGHRQALQRSTHTPQLEDSFCDGPTASTVFSFVDRERTAQENSSNPTETALAQLYAHIQSLPESSKKRKLIKQFNKENGQGTPLQLARSHKHVRSRSLGDSIKRHIFNKGLKRQKVSTNTGCFNALRSFSQEMLNSPLTSACGAQLFHSSTDEESPVDKELDPGVSLPVLQRSLCDSNSAVVRLRHSTRLSKASLTNRLVFSDSESGSVCNESNLSAQRAILHNLATQISEQRKSVSENSLVRLSDSEKNDCSPPKRRCGPDSCCEVSSPAAPGRLLDACGSEPRGDEACTPVSSACDPDVSLPEICSSSRLPARAINQLTTPQADHPRCLVTSTPASRHFARMSSNADVNHSNCLLTPIADENNSMSPITRSTQKMPKAMQETMMTPRSRKPVVVLSGSNICHLANVSGWQRREAASRLQPVSENRQDGDADCCSEAGSSQNEGPAGSSHNSAATASNPEMSHAHCCGSGSGESLTSTFKSYLMSRSVLTASPVDLSFSSRTGDFDTSVSEERCLTGEALSDSLLYCLDGHEPTDECCASGVAPSTSCSATEHQDKEISANSSESSETSNCDAADKGYVHETSL